MMVQGFEEMIQDTTCETETDKYSNNLIYNFLNFYQITLKHNVALYYLFYKKIKLVSKQK